MHCLDISAPQSNDINFNLCKILPHMKWEHTSFTYWVNEIPYALFCPVLKYQLVIDLNSISLAWKSFHKCKVFSSAFMYSVKFVYFCFVLFSPSRCRLSHDISSYSLIGNNLRTNQCQALAYMTSNRNKLNTNIFGEINIKEAFMAPICGHFRCFCCFYCCYLS